MVHDYHLMMLPQVLRRRLPGIYLTFSLHTPCPTHDSASSSSSLLTKVLTGALGSNMITLQALESFEDFTSWCTREIPDRSSYWQSRALDACLVLPMSIDVSRVTSISQSQAVGRKCDSLRSFFKGKKIVLSYNTLDTRWEMDDVVMGFERMLTQTPRWKEKVVLLQIICSSRAGDSLGEHSVSPFGQLTYSTNVGQDSCESEHVRYYNGQVSELVFHALLKASDTAIFPFTPGGPMTAGLEYFACRQGDNKRPIISDINPIARQIPEVITYHQGDIDSIARAINYALVLSDWPPMTKRHRELCGRGIMHTTEHWTSSVLYSLADNLLKSRFQMNLADVRSYNSCSPAGPTETESVVNVSGEEEGDGGDGREDERSGDGGEENTKKEDAEEDTETEDDEKEAMATEKLLRYFMKVERKGELEEKATRKGSATA